MSPSKKQIERFTADCKRGGVWHLDLESALRNQIIPPLFDEETFKELRPPS